MKSLWNLTLRLILWGSSILMSSYTHSKYTTPSTIAIHHYQQAEQYFVRKKYHLALQNLNKALTQDKQFIEVYLLMAKIYTIQNMLNSVLYVLDQGTRQLSKKYYNKKSIYHNLAQKYYYMGMYQEAKNILCIFNTYHKKNNKNTSIQILEKKIHFALTQKQNPTQVTKTILTSPLNQFDEQYFPILSLDEKIIYFTAIENGKGKENIYVSYKNNQGKWSKPISISKKINTKDANEGTCTLSANGKTIIFTSSKKKKSGKEICDLYISYKKNNVWTKPKSLGSNINSDGWESQPSLSADGKTLYFVSDRKENYGEKDIWKSKLQADGTWSRATNLGPIINTHGQECSPFIHPNGQTLFFSSNGRIGMGGFDIYYSNYINNTWTKPKNLGYPINNHKDQLSLFISADGKKGYYADGKRQGNIYNNSYLYTCTFDQPLNNCIPVDYIQGKIICKNSLKDIVANITVYDAQTNEKVAELKSDQEDGNFFIVLHYGKKYHIYFQNPGYLFYSIKADLTHFDSPSLQKYVNITLQPIQVGKPNILKNVFFDFDQAILKEQSRQDLDQLIIFLQQNPHTSVLIEGHTDDVGTAAYNFQLSVERAKCVYHYLIQGGISSERLTYKGWGKTKPLYTDPEKSDLNRRTAYTVVDISAYAHTSPDDIQQE